METPVVLNPRDLKFSCPFCGEDLSSEVKSATRSDVFEWCEDVGFSCPNCQDNGMYHEFTMRILFEPVLAKASITSVESKSTKAASNGDCNDCP
jgi:transcription elongation factor Elf1